MKGMSGLVAGPVFTMFTVGRDGNLVAGVAFTFRNFIF